MRDSFIDEKLEEIQEKGQELASYLVAHGDQLSTNDILDLEKVRDSKPFSKRRILFDVIARYIFGGDQE